MSGSTVQLPKLTQIKSLVITFDRYRFGAVAFLALVAILSATIVAIQALR